MQISKNIDLIPLNTILLGCASPKYRPAPVSPVALAAFLQSPTLQDDRPRAFLGRKLSAITAQWLFKEWTLPELTLVAVSAAKQRAKQKQNDQQKSGTGWVKRGIPD